MDLSVDVQQLDQDQRCECNRHNIDVRIIEEENGKQDDDTSLVDGHPDPDAECLHVERSALLQ